MKNAHGVEPSQYKKKKGNKTVIFSSPKYGPTFGSIQPDICIANKCTNGNSCWIGPSFCLQYESHPKYKSSLFVNTSGPDNKNSFSVLDYEVYTHN